MQNSTQQLNAVSRLLADRSAIDTPRFRYIEDTIRLLGSLETEEVVAASGYDTYEALYDRLRLLSAISSQASVQFPGKPLTHEALAQAKTLRDKTIERMTQVDASLQDDSAKVVPAKFVTCGNGREGRHQHVDLLSDRRRKTGSHRMFRPSGDTSANLRPMGRRRSFPCACIV
jgi:hypothetical protein